MIEVIQIAKDYDGAEDALKSLISQAEQASSSLEQSSNSLQEGLEDGLGTIHTSLEGFLTGLGEAEQLTVKQNDSVQEMIEAFNTGTDEADGMLIEHRSTLEQAEKDLVSEVEQKRDECNSIGDETTATIESAKELVGTITEAMQTAEVKTEEVINQFSEAVDGFRNQIDEGGETVGQGFEQLIGAVTGELKEASESVMYGLNDAIETVTETGGNGIEMMTGITEDTFANFEQGFRGMGDELEQRTTDILAELAAHVAETASAEVSEIVQTVLAEALAKLTAEIAEATALITTGGTVTSALGPILPQLAAAKAVVGAIEKALALLDAIF